MKHSMRSIAALLMAIILVIGCTGVTALAADKTELQKQSERQTAILVANGEYYGWTPQVSIRSTSDTQIITDIKLSNGDGWEFKIVQDSYVKNGNITTNLWIKEKMYTQEGIRMSLADYSKDSDVVAMLKTKSSLAADILGDYARSYGWRVTKADTSYADGAAQTVVTFRNGKWKFTATAKAYRGETYIEYGYLRDGRASRTASIQDWLKTYKV